MVDLLAQLPHEDVDGAVAVGRRRPRDRLEQLGAVSTRPSRARENRAAGTRRVSSASVVDVACTLLCGAGFSITSRRRAGILGARAAPGSAPTRATSSFIETASRESRRRRSRARARDRARCRVQDDHDWRADAFALACSITFQPSSPGSTSSTQTSGRSNRRRARPVSPFETPTASNPADWR